MKNILSSFIILAIISIGLLAQVSKPDGTAVTVPTCGASERLTHSNGTFTCVETSGGVTVDSTVLNIQALNSLPVDAQTIFFGLVPAAPATVAAQRKVHIRRNGTITRANIYTFSGTAGSAEAWSFYIRLNDTTDTLIQTVSATAQERIFFNTALSIPVVSGDYVEIKAVNPTWSVNPANTVIGGYIVVQ